VHLPIPDIQSLSVPAFPLPDYITDMWSVQAGLGFSLFCCGTMMYVLLYGGVKAESFVMCKVLFLISVHICGMGYCWFGHPTPFAGTVMMDNCFSSA